MFLSLVDASFRLGDRIVFERTSWVFDQHQHWAIIGPNGSGKSLFADALRGQLPLVQGQLRYHFRPASGLTPEESIAHVSFEDRKQAAPETVVQSRWNSIEEDCALRVSDFLSYERVNEINPFEITDRHAKVRPVFERRMRRVIKLLHLSHFLHRTLLSLSNGETQRVQLARTLAHPMRLLILDEPFAGLDAATREHFRRVLERLMSTRLRVLLISTRLEDLPRRISHLLCLEQCRVVAAGARVQILRDSRVRRLLSKPAPARGVPSKARSANPPSVSNPTDRDGSAAIKSLAKPLQRPSTSRPPPLVEMHNVTVRYGSATLLEEINWTIRAGESWALLGPNGSGKTTLLSLILGDNPQVYCNNVVVLGQRRGTGESIWQLKEQIGWVSPELHLYFDDSLTCLEVVLSGFHETVGLFEAPTRRQMGHAREWLAHLEMSEWAETPLYALSAGRQRLVFVARALVKRPRLLILDEPCQGLDSQYRRRLIEAVDGLVRSGRVTAVFVTHRMDEIPKSIQRVFRLSAGRGSIEPL